MQSPSYQILQRNLSLFEYGKWVIVNPDDRDVFSLSKNFVCGLHHDYRMYMATSGVTGPSQTFAGQWEANDISDDVEGFIVFMPKVKSLLSGILSNLLSIAKQPAKFVVVGENAGGVKSAKSIMEAFFQNVTKYDGARRCSLFIGASNFEVKTPKHQLVVKKQETTIKNTTLTVCSIPGVFGNKQLDPGTRLLLEHLPSLSESSKKEPQYGYDFACGTGVIGAYLSILYPQLSMTHSDVDALAILSTELTLKENGLDGLVKPYDGFLPTENKLDIIVTNPPFHNKLRNNYEITQTFIRDAYQQLARDGVLYLVANTFLPYKQSLEETFGGFDVLYADGKYTVYSAQRK